MKKENEYQTKEYVPHGPVIIQKPSKPKVKNKTKILAKPGWLYDAHTGLCLGPARDEMKAEHSRGEVWERHIARMRQKVVIG